MEDKILTITMNPSLDVGYRLQHLKIGDVNRVPSVEKTAGGKGLNVTRVINQTKTPVIASGILGGHIGKLISDKLKSNKIENNFYEIAQETRNCISIIHDDNQQTEILEPGPSLSGVEEDLFLKYFDQILSSNQIKLVTMSGSLPRGFSKKFYSKMIALTSNYDLPTILDTSGEELKESVNSETSKPYLIKPNKSELENLVDRKITSLNELGEVLFSNIFDGIACVVVTLGSNGAVAKVNGYLYKITIPKIVVKSPVGSGDSTIAGLAVGMLRQEETENVLKRGMSYGMANTMEEKTGYINIKNANALMNKIQIEKIN